MLVFSFILNFVACVLLAFAIIHRRLSPRQTIYVELFESFIVGTLFYCAETFLFVEFLSLFNALGTPYPLAALYSVATVAISVGVWFHRSALARGLTVWRETLPVPGIRTITRLIVMLVFLPLLFLAVYYPPCTADSMSYHLPRIFHWIQNGNVSMYPTNYVRQLFYQPFPEYLMLPWILMAGNDFFVNSVQTVFLFGMLSLVVLLIRHFGGGTWCQLLGVVMLLASPIVIFEAPTTQTDLIVVFLFLAFVYSGLKLCRRQPPGDRWLYAFCMGVSLGLSLNSKLSVAAFELPFCFWFGWRFLKVYRREAIPVYATLVVSFLVFNIPYFTRNYQLCGNPFGPPEVQKQLRNLRFGPDVVFSNAVRNIGMQMLTPVDGLNQINLWLVMQLHKGFDIPWNDPSISYTGAGTVPYPYETKFFLDDYRSGNTLIILLFSIVAFSLGGEALRRYVLPEGLRNDLHHEKRPPPKRKAKKGETAPVEAEIEPPRTPEISLLTTDFPTMRSDLTVYVWLLFFGFLIFSGLFRWQPFGSRLLLPVFLGVVPFIAIGLCRLLEPKRLYQLTISVFGVALLFIVFLTANSLFFDPLRSLVIFNEVPVEQQQDTSETNAVEPGSPESGELVDRNLSIKNVELVHEYFHTGNNAWEQYRFRRNYKYFRVILNYLADYLSICKKIDELGAVDIGLALDPFVDMWEYPFWPILKSRNPKIRIEWVVFPESHRNTRNYDPDFVPDVIITDYTPETIQERFEIEQAWKYEYLILAKVKKSSDDTESFRQAEEPATEHDMDYSPP